MNTAAKAILGGFSEWKGKLAVLRRAILPPAHRIRGQGDSSFVHLPQSLRGQLHRVRKRLLIQRWIAGGAVMASVLLALFLGQMLWDWFENLPAPARAGLLGLDLLVAALLGWICFGLPICNRESLEECALVLERADPAFRSALISAVQFSKNPPGPLEHAVFLQAASGLDGIDLKQALPAKPAARPAAVFGGLLAVAMACAAFHWPTAKVLLARVLLSNAPIPAETRIVSIPGDLDVEAGESVAIAVRAEGVLPRSGRVEVSRAGRPVSAVPMLAVGSGSGLYTASIPNVQEPFAYRVFLKGISSPAHRVDVHRSPVVASVTFSRRDPAYLNRPAVPLEAGQLSVFAGGKLGVSGESTQPLRAARVEFRNGATEALAVNGRGFSGDVPVPASGGEAFSIILENTGGTPSRNNTLHRLRVLRDDPPKVSWKPGGHGRRTVLVGTKPRLAFSAADNFQVTRVELVAAAESQGGRHEEVRIPLAIPAPAAGYDFDEAIEDPSAWLPWESGTAITYWIEAADNNTATGPGVGKSPVREWLIVSKDQKQEELFEQLDQAARRIKQVSENQKTLRNTTEELAKP